MFLCPSTPSGLVTPYCAYSCLLPLHVLTFTMFGAKLIDIQNPSSMNEESSTISRLFEFIALHIQCISFTALSGLLTEWKSLVCPPITPNIAELTGEDTDIADENNAVPSKVLSDAAINMESVLEEMKNAINSDEFCASHVISHRDSLRSILRRVPEPPLSCITVQPAADLDVGKEEEDMPKCRLRMDDWLACFLEDLVSALVTTTKTIISLPRPPPLLGIATLSSLTVATGNAYLNSNIRTM